MATLNMFRAQFPEMSSTSDILVTTMMSAAALELSPDVWGPYGTVGGSMTKADQGQLYLAAHKLVCSPWGQAAKMVSDKLGRNGYQRTQYGQEFLLMMRAVTSGFRVA